MKVRLVGIRRDREISPSKQEILNALKTEDELKVRFVKLENGDRLLYKDEFDYYNATATKLAGFVVKGPAVIIEK